MRRTLSAIFALTTLFIVFPADAQPTSPADCAPLRDLLTIPEIRSQSGRLQGVMMLSDEWRSLPGSPTAAGAATCAWQRLRYFMGFSGAKPTQPWPSAGEPLPGPTLRARVGDLVQLAFLNQVNPSNFPNTLDQGEQGKTDGCDVATASRKNAPTSSAQIYPRNDTYPNCLHGSSTANVHFHGTHTTPSTTGDNVLLFVRPALRAGGRIAPADSFVMEQFADFFKWCEANGSPVKFDQLPALWRDNQMKLLQDYDSTAPYKGIPNSLPAEMKLWPKNAARLKEGLWPQYSIGAFPYCFRLPAYDPKVVKMGQAPGTHWYHAHKHGSTALNVGNGMSGAFVIEGAYDDALRAFYRETPQHKNWGLQEQVLVIQQLDSALPLLSPTDQFLGGVKRPPLSVNGRVNPVLTMKPNQVQLWRVVNSAARNFVQFDSFTRKGRDGLSIAWRQIAQDGVQFSYPNYQRIGTVNAKFNLATANRADLLVRAPAQEAFYALQVVQSVSDVPGGTPVTLLTVRVKADDKKIDPPMDFIANEQDFPKFPEFLADIKGPIYKKRELTFNTNPSPARKGKGQMPLHEIDGKLFDSHEVNQTMLLNATEEWKIVNQTVGIAHPFHIHVNPFQIVEVFQPNSKEASTPGNPCYADPLKPGTWRPCQPLKPPFVWWDVFAIPTARGDKLPATVCTQVDQCPADIQPYTACANNECTVTIAGYFKMRSRFVDFTGQYVLHCHILAHEDRGMMQLVEVVPKLTTPYEHH